MARTRSELITQRFARGSAAVRVASEPRAVLFSCLPERSRWMENEVARTGIQATTAANISMLVDVLVHRRPTIAVVDLDRLDAGELFYLHRAREQGWGGTLVVLGRVPPSLRASLGIDRMVAPPFVEDALCDELQQHVQDSQAATTPIPIPMLA